jgi:hypothetical protein
MNFKKYYKNGDKWSLYIMYRGKNYHIEFESQWNGLMYRLTKFTTLRFVIEKEGIYYSIYKKYYFNKTLVEKWLEKDKAEQSVKQLYKKLTGGQ